MPNPEWAWLDWYLIPALAITYGCYGVIKEWLKDRKRGE